MFFAKFLVLVVVLPHLYSLKQSAAEALSSSYRTIIEFKNEKGRRAAINRAKKNSLGGNETVVVDASEFHFLVLDLASKDDAQALRKNPNIRSVERDSEPIFSAVPFENNEAHDSEDGGLDINRYLEEEEEEVTPEAVSMIQADQLSLGSDPPLVCVSDTGYALGHPDLPDESHVDGIDLTLRDERVLRWDEDQNGHGTETASVIAAIEGNGLGLRGASPGVNLFITRGLDDNRRSTVSQMMKSIQQCVDAGADIINLSMGCPCYDKENKCGKSSCYHEGVERYFAALAEKDIMVIAAAGNQGEEIEFYPASYLHVISVGAANRRFEKFPESNINDQVELVGLGHSVDVLSIDDGEKYSFVGKSSGTSAATPGVAAAAALLWSHFPNCNSTHIRTALGKTAINADGCNNRTGFGLVQAKAAHDLLQTQGCELDGRLHFGSEVTCEAEFLQPTAVPTTIAPTRQPSFAPTPAQSPQPTLLPTVSVSSEPTEPTDVSSTNTPSIFPTMQAFVVVVGDDTGSNISVNPQQPESASFENSATSGVSNVSKLPWLLCVAILTFVCAGSCLF